MIKFSDLSGISAQLRPLALGTSAFGEVFGPLKNSPQEIVLAALEAGINYFDTAPFYGGGLAEKRLGCALLGVRRESYVLSSKVGRYGVSEFDFSAARVIRSVDESLDRLRSDYLDVVYCHDIEFSEDDQIVEETLPALRSLRDTGKIRHVGISGLPIGLLARIARQDTVDVVMSYGHGTAINQELEDWVPHFQNLGVVLINAAPFAMGLLTLAGPPGWHPASVAIKAWCLDMGQRLRQEKVDIAQFALQFAMSQRGVHSTVASARSAEEIEQWRTWLMNPLPDSRMTEIMAYFGLVRGMA